MVSCPNNSLGFGIHVSLERFATCALVIFNRGFARGISSTTRQADSYCFTAAFEGGELRV